MTNNCDNIVPIDVDAPDYGALAYIDATYYSAK